MTQVHPSKILQEVPMPSLPHSSKSADHDEPDNVAMSNDPRNNSDESYQDMNTSNIDTDEYMPGDQPEDDTPPPLGRATGTEEPLDQ